MKLFRVLMMLGSLLILTGCGEKIRSYNGPAVTSVVVLKGERILHLMHGNEALRSFKFELGFTPEQHKFYEGDGRTPEGAYRITHHNPNSQFHLSIGISYPNDADRARARAAGLSPGGDIFIHGTPKAFRRKDDWTAGCIAVTNREIETIYAMVRDGTPIFIHP